MCSGIRDAQNICWKLNLVMGGIAPDKLLDSYQVERLPHVKEIMILATRMFKIFKTRNPIISFSRDFLLRILQRFTQATKLRNLGSDMPSLKNGILASSVSKKQPVAGKMFIQPKVRTYTGQLVLLDEVLGPHFTILGIDNNWLKTIALSSPSFFGNLPVSFVKVVPPGQQHIQLNQTTIKVEEIEDVSGQIIKWFTKRKKNVAIIRPDRYVFGAYNHYEMGLAAAQLRSLLKSESLLTMPKLATSKRI
jgi:3-(3-hydroxy-phenyl)propionate hydroxylase